MTVVTSPWSAPEGSSAATLAASPMRRAFVVSRKGSIGSVTWVDGPAWPIDTAYFVKPKGNNLDRRWAFWMLKSLQLETMNKSAAVPGLNCDDVHRLEVNLPSVPEQVRIASILDHADALRAKRPQVRGHLDTLTESIFQEMFASEPSTARSKRSPCRFERTRSEASYCITSLSMRASPCSVSTMSSATSSAGPSDASIKAIPAPRPHIHLQREFAERPSSGRRLAPPLPKHLPPTTNSSHLCEPARSMGGCDSCRLR